MGHPTIIVSYSELDSARQCLLKHQLGYRDRWTQDLRSESALSRGILWHEVMEARYRAFKRVAQRTGRNALDEQGELEIATLLGEAEQRSPDQELIAWMYDGYCRHWGNEQDWHVVAVEHAAQVRLPTPSGGASRFVLKMKIDLIVTINGKVVIVDHKSGRNLPTDKDLALNDQFGLYTWALRQLGKPVFGSMHNGARTQRNKDDSEKGQPLETRFKKTPMYRTDRELDAIALDAYEWAKLAWQKRDGNAPRSPNEDTCSWKCSYTEPCLAARKGIDSLGNLMVDFGFHIDKTRH